MRDGLHLTGSVAAVFFKDYLVRTVDEGIGRISCLN